MVLLLACQPSDPVYHQLMTEDYPDLYEAVFARDANTLMDFTSSPNEDIQKQAWRALISTPVTDIDTLITLAKEQNIQQAWMAVSMKTLTDDQLNGFQKDFLKNADLRAGISEVLGRAGNVVSLNFLLDKMNTIKGNTFEKEAALAIGRLLVSNDLGVERMQEFLPYIFDNNDQSITKSYLYGFHRGRKLLDKSITDEMLSFWSESDRSVQQYLIRILYGNHAEFIHEQFPEEVAKSMNSQMAVELGRLVPTNSLSESALSTLIGLLNHENESVAVTVMQSVSSNDSLMSLHPEVAETLEMLIEDDEKDHVVRIEAGLALSILDASKLDGYSETIDEIASTDEYYYRTRLQIQANKHPDRLPLDCSDSSSDIFNNDLKLFFSTSALSAWWNELDTSQKETHNEKVRECGITLLEIGNRSIATMAIGFVADEDLFTVEDYDQIEAMFSRFSLPADIELYQIYGRVLFDRFKDQAQSFVDSIAAKNNSALNAAWASAGWDIEAEEIVSTEFRTPDWTRLSKLGSKPEMKISTDKGDIRILLYPKVAPATISGMDSLAAAGDYDDVAFHRVVQNFVIQGGDVETGNGFGGPDFVVPTEGSELDYTRGKVGIASAGTDTEGSQYFIMHDWAPHLNGRYSIIGEVISGMDVVDRITVGDKVKRLRIVPGN